MFGVGLVTLAVGVGDLIAQPGRLCTVRQVTYLRAKEATDDKQREEGFST